MGRVEVVAASNLICLWLTAFASPSSAASFDCSRVTNSRERAVCRDAELSQLDGQVAKLYSAALAQLSTAGAQRLREGQREWQAYLSQACPITARDATPEELDCLQRAYQTRVEDLKMAAVRRGPFLFTRVDVYAAEKAPPDDDQDSSDKPPRPEIGQRHAAYPQIDDPKDAEASAWNKLVVQSAPGTDCGSAGNDDISYSLGLATGHLVSVTWTYWEYCHGTPHGHGGGHVQNLILISTPRPLEPGDLFRPETAWKDRIAATLFAQVEKDVRDGGGDLSRLNRDAVLEAAASPRRWSLSDDGLTIQFDPYELGEGYPFAPSVTVPWSALEEFLVADPTKR